MEAGRRAKGLFLTLLAGALVAGRVRVAAGASNDVGWAEFSSSPTPDEEAGLGPLERAAILRCGRGEGGLTRTARWVATRRANASALPDPGALARAQRGLGEPHPWARLWTASAPSSASPDGWARALAKLNLWLGQDAALRRCGVAVGRGEDGTETLVVVAVDALADLAPLPIRVRVGQWLDVEASLHVPAAAAHVFVLGPTGQPRGVPTTFDRRRARARFAPDTAGEFSVQVMADVDGGPRPVLEAVVLASVEAPQASPQATGISPPRYGNPSAEAVGPEPFGTDQAVLLSLVEDARASHALRWLRPDARLDALAAAHARAMVAARVLAHDAGDGDPESRLFAAGLMPVRVAENVAHAPTLAGAFEETWSSPSHRANLLAPKFDAVGVAVVRDDHGEPWLVELFTAGGVPQ